MSLYTVLFSSVIPAKGTRQINKTFMKGLLTIQDQEHFKTHNKRKLRQQYRKSRFSGDKTAPLAVSFHHAWAAILDVFENFRSARIGNSFLILLGCPFGRYDLGTTLWEASGTYPRFQDRSDYASETNKNANINSLVVLCQAKLRVCLTRAVLIPRPPPQKNTPA